MSRKLWKNYSGYEGLINILSEYSVTKFDEKVEKL